MISKDELVKNVAEKCGVALEISNFFFEVFVNRVSNKLKPGEIIKFDNFGYFHKRNCRIHLEKTSDTSKAKAYLVQLVLFSLEPKVNSDLNFVHFLKIPNLKTLWVDDREFQDSLKAGDFSPFTERNQLIKSFATKAEVIISGLRKDYDNDLENELVIPLTFDLNFLIKKGQKSNSEKKLMVEKTEPDEKKKIESKSEELNEDGLPWSYGTKFLEKKEELKAREVEKKRESLKQVRGNQTTNNKRTENAALDAKDKTDPVTVNKKNELKDFQQVPSRLSSEVEEVDLQDEYDTIKFTVGKTSEDRAVGLKATNKFIEVKSKTEAYRLREDERKLNKKDTKSRLSATSEGRSANRKYRESRNLMPYIVLFAFVVIAGAAVYFYLIKNNTIESGTNEIVYDVKPPSEVNIIERDYEFAVTYPYPKTEGRIEISGYNPEMFFIAEVKPEIAFKEKPKETPKEKPVKTEEVKEKPKTEVKQELPKEEKPDTGPDITEQQGSRIFLHKNYYVVHVGNFKSSEAAYREADRYFDLGYNAFVEVLESRGKGTLYKLNVGDFTSEEFAKQFESKYIK